MLEEALKVSLLQIELNNRLLYILQPSIRVSLIAVSLEQLIYLFLTRCCLLPIPSRTLQRHPCPLGRPVQNEIFHFFPHFFLETRAEDVFNGGKNRYRLGGGVGEEGASSNGRDP
jgi:hypothetical protein